MRRTGQSFLLVLSLFIGSSVYASQSGGFACESALSASTRPLTLNVLEKKSAERIRKIYEKVPAPGFDLIEQEVKIEQVGEIGPRSLQDFLTEGISFVSTPAPTSPTPVAVDLLEEGRSFPVHVDLPWEGERTSTAAYVSLPLPKVLSAGDAVIGPEYPVVYVHMHGGGTPTATGRNAMSIGKELGKRGIPVLGIDLPGHGRATRKLKGQLTVDQQLEWMMQVVEKLTHPNSKIIFSGHSYGAMYAAMLHRRSTDPRFQRIIHYISLAPGIDVSMGTDIRKKDEFEENWQKNFHDYVDKIAPADFEFSENMLANGKNSNVSSLFTTLMGMDYLTPPLTDEDVERLAPLDLIAAENDGMTTVGREEPLYKIFGALQDKRKSNLIMMGPATNWKSKNEDDKFPTGHNQFDAYIPGTKTVFIYKFIGDRTLQYTGELPVYESTGDNAKDVMDWIFRYYANFFAFRELVKDHVEYVAVDTPERVKVSKRRAELDDYIRKAEPLEEALQRVKDGKGSHEHLNKSVEALRVRLGIKDNLNFQRAQEELGMPELTEERAAELKAYLAANEQIEKDLRATYQDPEYSQATASLSKANANLLEQLEIKDISEYKIHYDQYQRRKDLTPKESKLRGELSRIHQTMTKLLQDKQARFGMARNSRMASIKTPAGIFDFRMAQRELNADRSIERRSLLKAFIDAFPAVEAEVREAQILELADKLEKIPHPENVADLNQAKQERQTIEEMMGSYYAPPNQPHVLVAAMQVKKWQDQLDAVEGGGGQSSSLDQLQANVRALKNKRAGKLKAWDGLWKTDQLTSELLAQKSRSVARLLEDYKSIYFGYEKAAGEWLREMKLNGQLSVERILAGTPQVNNLRAKVLRAKQVYFSNRHDLELMRWTEAIQGRLEGPEGMVKEASKVAIELWGQDFVRHHQPDVNSLTANLRGEEEYLEKRLVYQSQLSQKLSEARAEYAELMQSKGLEVVTRVERVNVSEALELPLEELLARLRSDSVLMKAFTQTLNTWEGFLKTLRTESQVRDNSY